MDIVLEHPFSNLNETITNTDYEITYLPAIDDYYKRGTSEFAEAVTTIDNLFLIGGTNASDSAESFEIRVNDGYEWSEWYTINITTGANNLATVTSSTTLTDLNLNQWYLLST